MGIAINVYDFIQNLAFLTIVPDEKYINPCDNPDSQFNLHPDSLLQHGFHDSWNSKRQNIYFFILCDPPVCGFVYKLFKL